MFCTASYQRELCGTVYRQMKTNGPSSTMHAPHSHRSMLVWFRFFGSTRSLSLLIISTNNIVIGLVRIHKIRFRSTKVRFRQISPPRARAADSLRVRLQSRPTPITSVHR
jgi:hypothetical protein